MIEFEYLIILGTIALLSCIVWTSLSRLTMDSGTDFSSVGSKCSPSRRNRRGRRVKRSPNSNSQNVRQSQRRRVHIVDSDNASLKMNVDEKTESSSRLSPQKEKMDIDDQNEDNGSDSESDSEPAASAAVIASVKSERSPNLETSPSHPKDFSHPIYKEMSLRNGFVNRMSKVDLQKTLRDLGLNNLGSADVLKRRLKHHYSSESLKTVGLSSEVPQKFDYLCVIDVEATCQQINPIDYIHEIIEFPIVLVNTRTSQIEDTFEAFSKPVVNPKLSEFCSQLTHITQTMVNKADKFPAVLEKVEAWMNRKGLGTKYSFAIATDCSLDMDLYLKLQCLVSEIPYPPYAKEWINVSKVFANLYKTKRVPLRAMLDSIGLGFMGQPHRGIDDARNIARICLQLLEDGAELKCNEKLTST